MQKNIFTGCFLLLLSLAAYSQKMDTTGVAWTASYKKDFSILAGYHQGKYGFADIGLAMNYYGSNRHPFSVDYFVSNEIRLGRNMLIGPKIGVWAGGGSAMGINFIYYTNFDKACFVFRPEIGIGIEKLKFVYGYNWNWTKAFDGINKHQVGITYCLTLKRLKSLERPVWKSTAIGFRAAGR